MNVTKFVSYHFVCVAIAFSPFPYKFCHGCLADYFLRARMVSITRRASTIHALHPRSSLRRGQEVQNKLETAIIVASALFVSSHGYQIDKKINDAANIRACR